MDICDISSQYEETYLMSAIKQNQNNLEAYNKPTQTCLYCGEPVTIAGSRFCCKECRDEYEHELRVKQILGKA